MRKANLDAHPGSDWDPTGDGSPVKSPLRDHVRLRLLVGAHVLGGLLACGYSAVEGRIPFVLEYLPVVPHLAINLGQACLLGSWAAFSGASWWKRLAGLILGAVSLEILLAAGGGSAEFSGMAALVSVGVAGALLAARRRGARLLRIPKPPDPPASPGLRFTIRSLMLGTLVIALLIAGAKSLQETLGGGPMPFVIATWSLCFVAVGLAAVWAALGLARPLQRSLVVLALALSLGVLFSFGINEGWDTYFYIVTIMVLQAVIVLGSLLVVRSCGYRLVSQPLSHPDRPEELGLADESVSR